MGSSKGEFSDGNIGDLGKEEEIIDCRKGFVSAGRESGGETDTELSGGDNEGTMLTDKEALFMRESRRFGGTGGGFLIEGR